MKDSPCLISTTIWKMNDLDEIIRQERRMELANIQRRSTHSANSAETSLVSKRYDRLRELIESTKLP